MIREELGHIYIYIYIYWFNKTHLNLMECAYCDQLAINNLFLDERNVGTFKVSVIIGQRKEI